MSEPKRKHIFYRNEKIYVDDEGYVRIEGEKYLVVKAVDQEFIAKYFGSTKTDHSLDGTSTIGKFLNKRCIFDCGIYFLGNNSIDLDSLAFSNSIFLKNVTIKQGYTVSGKVNPKTPSDYQKLSSFLECSSIPSFSFNNVKFEDECLIECDYNKNNLSFTFNQCHFAKKLKIRNSEQRLRLQNGTDFRQHNQTAQKIKLHLNQLCLIDCSADDGAYLRIGFVSVKDFVLSNLRLPQNAELNIGDCHFENFKLTNFRNVGKFKLYKINILDIKHNYFDGKPYRKNETKDNEEFQIDNTSIGKTDFQSVNIGSFANVVIFDNIFTGIDYTNVVWGDKDIDVGQYNNYSDGDDEKTKINKLEKQQDTYRTLKNVALKNNDQPQAIKFYAKEMDYHYQIVNNNNKKHPLSSDRATLRFNKYTNDFGLNFWLPLKWLLGVSIVSYILLLCLLPISDLSVNVLDWSKFFARFFIFLNPTHKVEDVFGGDWNGWAHAIDFIFRVIEGLLIYQTIQAFRKYSRKL